jgi:hypothetical protein
LGLGCCSIISHAVFFSAATTGTEINQSIRSFHYFSPINVFSVYTLRTRDLKKKRAAEIENSREKSEYSEFLNLLIPSISDQKKKLLNHTMTITLFFIPARR